MQVHRKAASEQAVGIGLVDPEGPGSWTHPHLTRMLYADGKVVTPLFKAQAGDTKVDKQTGEIKALPYEPDAEKGSKKRRRGEGQRVEKNVHFEDNEVTLPDGSVRTLRLFAPRWSGWGGGVHRYR